MSDPVIVSSRSIHDGRIVKLALEEVRLPNGHTIILEIIKHPGAAAVVPLDADGNVILVRQYRHATGSWLLEVPAGKLDHPGESPEDCALREVEEETGYRAGRLSSLGWIWTTPGFTDEKIHLFMASGLTQGAHHREADEFIELKPVSISVALAMIERGEIQDAKTALALLYAAGFRM